MARAKYEKAEKDRKEFQKKWRKKERERKKFKKARTARKAKGGCYVATAVYGSYDCPQVWTLRRFRDYSLSTTWHGRLFVRLYYACSPVFVRLFGRTRLLNVYVKRHLDILVQKLNQRGYSDNPYKD